MGALESLLVGVFGAMVPWVALVVIAVCAVSLKRTQRDAAQAARGARGLAALAEIDAELHALAVEQALARLESGTGDRADVQWLTSLVRRAHERRPEGESAFWKVVADDTKAAEEQQLRCAVAQASATRIEAQARRIATHVPAVEQAWLDALAAHA